MDRARRNLSGKAAEILMRANYTLNWQPECGIGSLDGERKCFEKLEDTWAPVERHALASMHDVVAIESADVVLMSGDLRNVPAAIALSRAAMRNVRENLGWAFGYNVLLIPMAAGLLWPAFGILLSPMVAGLAMALSSVSVVANALRLRRFAPPSPV